MRGLDCASGQYALCAGYFDQCNITGRFAVSVAPVNRDCEVFGCPAGHIVKAGIGERRRIQRNESTLINGLVDTRIYGRQDIDDCYGECITPSYTIIILDNYCDRVNPVVTINMRSIHCAICSQA